MIFDILAPPQSPRGRGNKNVPLHAYFKSNQVYWYKVQSHVYSYTRTITDIIHVSNSHTKFGWISSNGLGGDSVTDGPTHEQMEAIAISLMLF